MRELASILVRLWRLRAWVLLVVTVAAVVGILTVLRPTGDSPFLERRATSTAVAQTELLVDTRSSSIGDAEQDLEDVAARAAVYARFAQLDEVRELAAQRADVPAETVQIDVVVADAGSSGPPTPVDEALSPDSADEMYVLTARVPAEVPVVSLSAQAPTLDTARELVDGATDGLVSYVTDFVREEQEISDQIVLSRISPTVGRPVTDGTPIALGAVLAVLIVLLGCGAVLLVDGLRSAIGSERRGVREAAEP